MKTPAEPFAVKQTVVILAPVKISLPIQIKLRIKKIFIKLVNFNIISRWLTSIVFCFLKFITFLHIVCFKIYIIIIYLGPHWPNIGLPEKVETIWLTIPKAGIIKM